MNDLILDNAGIVDTTLEQDIQLYVNSSNLDRAKMRRPIIKKHGIRASDFDILVRELTPANNNDCDLKGARVEFNEPEPWDKTVGTALLAEEVVESISKHITMEHKSEAIDAIAMWVMHAHVYDEFLATPRLNITAPDYGCGKTELLDVIQPLLPRARRIHNPTSPVVFRFIHEYTATLMFDEYNKYLPYNKDLQALINEGYKSGGVVPRCEGDKNEIREFNVFAPVALAGIGDIPPDLFSRCITINMRRAKRGEIEVEYDPELEPEKRMIKRKIIRWADDNRHLLKQQNPDMGNLINRYRVVWRPLFHIAQLAGGDWIDRVNASAKKLIVVRSHGTVTDLLVDIRELFYPPHNLLKVHSHKIIEHLRQKDHRPWPEKIQASEQPTNWLGRKLHPFGVRSKNITIGGVQRKGFEYAQFADVFDRHIGSIPLESESIVENPPENPPENPSDPSGPYESNKNNGLDNNHPSTNPSRRTSSRNINKSQPVQADGLADGSSSGKSLKNSESDAADGLDGLNGAGLNKVFEDACTGLDLTVDELRIEFLDDLEDIEQGRFPLKLIRDRAKAMSTPKPKRRGRPKGKMSPEKLKQFRAKHAATAAQRREVTNT